MKILINLLSLFNLIFGIVALLPCLMAGLMSMDSPQAQHSILAHLLMYLILSFPVVCWIFSVLPYRFPKYSIFISLFPTIEATTFFTVIWMLSK